MNRKILKTLVLLLLVSLNVTAKGTETIPIRQFKGILNIGWENDFVNQTDHYFTNGLSISYYSPVLEKSPLNFLFIPGSDPSRDYYGLSMVQNIYTPKNLNDPAAQLNDRPFASYLIVSNKKISLDPYKRLKLTSEIRIGWIGKYAGGEVVQNGVHSILPTSEPVDGWEKQIQDEFCFSYNVELEKGISHLTNIELNGYGMAMIGTPVTAIGTGLRLRGGLFDNYFANLSVDSDYDWQAFAFADISGQWVAYNATLQGGILNSENQHLRIRPASFIGKATLGFSIVWKNYKFDFGQQFITPEFDGGSSHKWGYVNFTIGL